MADVPRSLAALKTLLADNTAGDISPQDLRDMLVSCVGVYGSMSCFEASVEQTDPDTGAILTCWDTNGAANGTTPNHTNNYIVAGVAGVFDIFAHVSFLGTNSSTIKMRLRVNGVEKSFGFTRKLGSTDVGDASFLAPGITLAVDDQVSVYVESDGATDDLTVVDAQLTVRMVG